MTPLFWASLPVPLIGWSTIHVRIYFSLIEVGLNHNYVLASHAHLDCGKYSHSYILST